MSKKRRKVGAVKVNKDNKEKEASAMSTIMRLMKEERKKAISRRIIRKRRMRKENWEI